MEFDPQDNLAPAATWFDAYPSHSIEARAWATVRAELDRLRKIEAAASALVESLAVGIGERDDPRTVLADLNRALSGA